jgi:PAS domain S-box-containing protein
MSSSPLPMRMLTLRNGWQRYGFAVAVCLVAGAVTAPMIVALHGIRTMLALLAAMLLAGWYGGVGPSVLALALCLAIDRVLPAYVGKPVVLTLAVRDLWFVGFAIGAARFGTVRRSLIDALYAANERLEAAVAEQTRELRRKERYLEEAGRLSHTGCWAVSSDPGQRLYGSPETFRLLGFAEGSDVRGWHAYAELVDAEERQEAVRLRDEARREQCGWEDENRITVADGTRRIVRSVGCPYFDDQGKLVEYIGVIMDVTEQRRIERDLRRARERSIHARFAARLAERNRIAREMHDTLLQGFTGVALKLVAATSHLASSSGDAVYVTELREVIGLAQRTLEEARRAIWEIRGTPAGDGLSGAVRAAADEVAQSTGLCASVEVVGVPRAVDPMLDRVVMSITREALVNAARHSGAATALVRLTYRPRSVRLVVRDEGSGFVVDPEYGSYGGHWGLLGMREHASEVGGRLGVRSAPGSGTYVVATFPTRRGSRRGAGQHRSSADSAVLPVRRLLR